MTKLRLLTASVAMVAITSLCAAQVALAGPPGGSRGPGPGPGWGGGPHHHSGWGGALAGAAVLGLGLGVAGLIANSTAPAPVTTYVPPGYVAPSYVVPAAPVVVTPPPAVVTTPVPSGTTMYWCEASKNFYPYVTTCSSGWQARIMP